jgi:hypothetical protein
MGIDLFVCHLCDCAYFGDDEIFTECCGSSLCKNCGESYDKISDCILCTKDPNKRKFNDSQILTYLLDGRNIKDIKKEMRNKLSNI